VPPGPRGLAVLGFLGGGAFQKTLDFLAAQTRRHGPIVSFRLLARRLYVLDDPELVRQVLVVQQQRFSRATGAEVLRDVVGTSLVTSEEPLHRERRRMMQPAFHRERIARYGATVSDEARRVAADVCAGRLVDIGAAMTSLTLGVTGRALFGAGPAAAHARHMNASLVRAMRAMSRLGPVLEVLPPAVAAVRHRLPLRSNAEFARARADLRTIVQALVDRRRAQPQDAGDADDLLGLVLAARDADGRPLDDAAVADELSTLFLAGHETTATALTWTWYLLARHRAVEERWHAELDAVLGDRDPTSEDLARLPYSDALFSEALRLYPPASAFGRRALEACDLGGYRIPRGAGIIISPYVVHRNPRYFPEPERFAPERWATPGWPEFAYVPFGGGARRCIGEGFARMEGVLALATLGRRFRFALEEHAPVGIASATLRPERPIRLRAFARRRASFEVKLGSS
jgi:cytochrome P450